MCPSLAAFAIPPRASDFVYISCVGERSRRCPPAPTAREATPCALLTVFAICADTDAEAERLAASIDLRRLNTDYGVNAPVPTQQEAESRTYSAVERARVAHHRRRVVLGAPETVKARLSALQEPFEADELMVITITGDYRTRLRSYELISDAFALCQHA